MNIWKIVSTLGLLPLLGCGSSTSSSQAAASDAGADALAIALNDPETDFTQTKTITMDSFVVPAGEEVYECQDFANPWGDQVDIKTYSLQMSPGSHHMFAFYVSNATDGAIEPCPNGGLQFGAFTFTAQQPQLTETFPATVGATIPQGTGFQLMAHYLNAVSGQHRRRGAARDLDEHRLVHAAAGRPDHVVGQPHAPLRDELRVHGVERRDAVHDHAVGRAARQAVLASLAAHFGDDHHLDVHLRQHRRHAAQLRRVGAQERDVHLDIGLLPGIRHQ